MVNSTDMDFTDKDLDSVRIDYLVEDMGFIHKDSVIVGSLVLDYRDFITYREQVDLGDFEIANFRDQAINLVVLGQFIKDYLNPRASCFGVDNLVIKDSSVEDSSIVDSFNYNKL